MRLTLLSLLLCCSLLLQGQDPTRFSEEIQAFRLEKPKPCNCILFTGSSSIRLWTTLQTDFPSVYVKNHGFGGSHFSDLLYYVDSLILQHQPNQIFIYEGDNDIAAGESPRRIMKEARQLLAAIRAKMPQVEVVLISAKPSIARWSDKKKYEKLNAQLAQWAKKEANLKFIDVWTPMLLPSGEVDPSLFVEDQLHMNGKGYRIWAATIRPFLKT